MENYSLADIAAATGSNDGLFGGGADGILALIIIFVLLFGRNGFGNNEDCCTRPDVATQEDVQRGFDTSTITSKLDGIANGICDSTYTLNNTIQNGFANSNLANVQGFNSVNNGICSLDIIKEMHAEYMHSLAKVKELMNLRQ